KDVNHTTPTAAATLAAMKPVKRAFLRVGAKVEGVAASPISTAAFWMVALLAGAGCDGCRSTAPGEIETGLTSREPAGSMRFAMPEGVNAPEIGSTGKATDWT